MKTETDRTDEQIAMAAAGRYEAEHPKSITDGPFKIGELFYSLKTMGTIPLRVRTSI
jgi:hypothetical protein